MSRYCRWIIVLGMLPLNVMAAYSDHERITPARLSHVEGDAAFRRGADAWTRAMLNTPLAIGDTLQTGADGRVELQLAPTAFVRAAGHSVITIRDQTEHNFGIDVPSGTLAIDWRQAGGAEPMSLLLQTPHGQIGIDQPGYYRVEVTPTDSRVAVRDGGLATATPNTAEPFDIQTEQGAGLSAGAGTWTLASGLGTDHWDEWNRNRTDQILSSVSRQYLAENMYGAEALDQHGTWQQHRSYGPVWYPRSVGRTWAPFSTGSWLHDPRYGWSWVDQAAWGWAPFHYGRWLNVGGRWGWAPRSRFQRESYVPAVVRFLDGPYAGTSVIRWVPLGWDDPFDPYWHPGWTIGSRPRHRVGDGVRQSTPVAPSSPPVIANAPAVISMPATSFGRLPILPVPSAAVPALVNAPNQVLPVPAGGASAIERWTAPAQNPGVAPSHPLHEAIEQARARQATQTAPATTTVTPVVVNPATVPPASGSGYSQGWNAQNWQQRAAQVRAGAAPAPANEPIAPTVTTPNPATAGATYPGFNREAFARSAPRSSLGGSAGTAAQSAPAPSLVTPQAWPNAGQWGAGARSLPAPAAASRQSVGGGSDRAAGLERRAAPVPRTSVGATGGGSSLGGGALAPQPRQGLGTFLGAPGCTSPACAGKQ